MESALPLADAYQRLLGELSRRLGASRAELLLHLQGQPAPHEAASYGAADAADETYTWLDFPICEGALEVGRLHMAFAPNVPLPGPRERALTQALVELVALLVEERQQLTWGPIRQAGRRILAVTEEEFQRIILDIHDGPVQKLFAVSARIPLLQTTLESAPQSVRAELGPALDQIAGLIESALLEIRNTLSTFRPGEFQRRTLPEVLEGLALQHETLTGNLVDLYVESPIAPVSLPVKIALYRVLQEALSNAYRHAGVSRHEVRLRQQAGWVELEVIDQGRGFTPPLLEGPTATEREEHIGLRGMRDRAQLVGGQMRVESRPGNGTRVIVMVPGNA